MSVRRPGDPPSGERAPASAAERTDFTTRPSPAELDLFEDVSDVDDETNLDGQVALVPPEAALSDLSVLSVLEAEDVEHARTAGSRTGPVEIGLAIFGEGALLTDIADPKTDVLDAPLSSGESPPAVQRWSAGEVLRTRVDIGGAGARPVPDTPEARRLIDEARRFIAGALEQSQALHGDAAEASRAHLEAALEALAAALARLPP